MTQGEKKLQLVNFYIILALFALYHFLCVVLPFALVTSAALPEESGSCDLMPSSSLQVLFLVVLILNLVGELLIISSLRKSLRGDDSIKQPSLCNFYLIMKWF